MSNGWYLLTATGYEGALAGSCHTHDCYEYISGATHQINKTSSLRKARSYLGVKPSRNDAGLWYWFILSELST